MHRFAGRDIGITEHNAPDARMYVRHALVNYAACISITAYDGNVQNWKGGSKNREEFSNLAPTWDLYCRILY